MPPPHSAASRLPSWLTRGVLIAGALTLVIACRATNTTAPPSIPRATPTFIPEPSPSSTPEPPPTSTPIAPTTTSAWPDDYELPDVEPWTNREVQDVWVGEAVEPIGPLVSVDYQTVSSSNTLALPPEASLGGLGSALGLTPDGEHVWLSIPDPTGTPTCSDGDTSTILAIARLITDPDAPDNTVLQPVPAQPADALRLNITEIHQGPGDEVVLYSGCGKYGGPTALARAQPDGNFFDIRLIDPLFSATLWAWPPRWGHTYGYDDDPMDLIAVIPQEGITGLFDYQEGSDEPFLGPVDVYLDFATGDIVEIWPSEAIHTSWTAAGWTTADKNSVLLGYEPSEIWSGSVTAFVPDPGWATTGFQRVAVAGTEGAVSFHYGSNGEAIQERITTRSVVDAVWSPIGQHLVLTGPQGTTIHHFGAEGGPATSRELSSTPGTAVEFTTDGSAVVIAETTGVTLVHFADADQPDLDELHAFSPLDSGGLGPIRIGMLVSQLEATLGRELQLNSINDELTPGTCAWIAGDPMDPLSPLGILVEVVEEGDAMIRTVTVRSGPWRTPSGIGIGTTDDIVLDEFPEQIEVNRHVYNNGWYYDFVPNDRDDPNSVRFEVFGDLVTVIHVGDREWVRYIEGCA